ncbi:MAG: hypothetical protein WBA93_22685 [Microcoleaceae cyanobacterium]
MLHQQIFPWQISPSPILRQAYPGGEPFNEKKRSPDYEIKTD